MSNTDYITIAEAAKLLGVSKYYVYFLVKGRTRDYGKRKTFEPPRFTRVIKMDKQHYTWYLIHIDEITSYMRNRNNGKRANK
jgi:hypothetical protein